MTYYRPRVIEGCVVPEFRAWQHHPSNGPVRLALDSVQRLNMHADTHELNLVDADGNHHVVQPGDYVFERGGGRLAVMHPSNFESEYEVSP